MEPIVTHDRAFEFGAIVLITTIFRKCPLVFVYHVEVFRGCAIRSGAGLWRDRVGPKLA